jgi:hypothetical protein
MTTLPDCSITTLLTLFPTKWRESTCWFVGVSYERSQEIRQRTRTDRNRSGRCVMSTDPFVRFRDVFGDVVARKRRERTWTAEQLATACQRLSSEEIRNLEAGNYIPTLRDFFHHAVGLRESPVILLSEIINAWRTDPADYGLYKSRPSDMARLHRLGYFHDPGDFRELPRAYDSLDHATADARKINITRVSKGDVLVNFLTIYLRVGHIQVDPTPEEESPQCSRK